MLRWFGPRKVQNTLDGQAEASGEVTDDPLAAIDPNRKGQRIYSVSRINPLFDDNLNTLKRKRLKKLQSQMRIARKDSPQSGEKSNSSGYGGSHGEGSSHEPPYVDKIRLRDDVVSVVEQNSSYVKSIQVATASGKEKCVPSFASASSGAGTLSTIPEGKVDLSIPRPIWPRCERNAGNSYDSLVDEALLLYTNANYVPSNESDVIVKDVTLRDILIDLSNCISTSIDDDTGLSAEEMLKCIKDKISESLNIIRNSSEEDVRKLYVNLSNREKVNSVVRAFSNSSSSGNSSQSSPELNGARVRSASPDVEEIYQVPSGSSSSGFSDSIKNYGSKRVAAQEEVNLTPSCVRNAIIYGTLCRTKLCSADEKLLDKADKKSQESSPKKSLLLTPNDNRPSVWQQYYGINLVQEGEIAYAAKPTDVPLYPGGRPEADFTLDVPRSEMLAKRMKQDKKWRCRCRLLTSFLGLVFFLLSVMAVSLMLTRGKRMFGSMV